MPSLERREFKKHLKRLSLAPILILILVSGTLTAQILRQRSHGLSVDQADREISATSRIFRLLIDMETGFRGFLLGRQAVFLEPYELARTSLQNELLLLRNFGDSNPEFQERVAELETSVGEWVRYASSHIAGGSESSKPNFVDLVGKQKMDQIRGQVQQLLTMQEKYRNQQTAQYDRQLIVSIFAVFSLLLLSAIFLGFFSRKEATWVANSFEETLGRVHKQTEHYRAIFDGVKDYGIALLSPDGTIQTWNPASETLTGFAANEVIGKEISLLNPDATDDFRNSLTQAEIHGRYETSGWQKKKEGTRFWADMVFTALWEANGKLRGFSTIFRDFSLRRHIEEERAHLINKLEEGIRSRDEFLALASHELKTPIASILLRVQQIQRTEKKNQFHEVSKNTVEMLLRQLARLTRLIDNILDVVRIHAGTLPYHFKEVQFSELVTHIIEDHKDLFDEANCPLTLEIEPNLVAQCDPFRVEQIVINLLTNALKHACHGPIRIRASTSGENVEFSIDDAGPGIPKEHQEKIFERFERASPDESISGLGLGLYIAKEFVEAHGGELSLRSEPGQGAEFKFTIPIENSLRNKNSSA